VELACVGKPLLRKAAPVSRSPHIRREYTARSYLSRRHRPYYAQTVCEVLSVAPRRIESTLGARRTPREQVAGANYD
jgi:hypothetical protein